MRAACRLANVPEPYVVLMEGGDVAKVQKEVEALDAQALSSYALVAVSCVGLQRRRACMQPNLLPLARMAAPAATPLPITPPMLWTGTKQPAPSTPLLSRPSQ